MTHSETLLNRLDTVKEAWNGKGRRGKLVIPSKENNRQKKRRDSGKLPAKGKYKKKFKRRCAGNEL